MHEVIENADMRISYREGNISGEHIFEKHLHARYEIIAVIEGEIRIVIENRRYDLRAGEMALIPPLKYHSVFALDSCLYKRITVLFDKELIPCEIEDDFISKTAEHPIASGGAVASAFASMKDIFSESERERFLPLAKSLLTEVLYTHTYRDSTPARDKINPIIQKITEYVEAHISEKILLDDIAAHVFVSKSSVCHIFANEMKISLKQYVLQKKLSHAARLINEGERAAEAARLVGYENYANFYKMYVKIFGASPMKTK